MADKLLSQADVDALVGSLSRNKKESTIAVKPTPEANNQRESAVHSVTFSDAVKATARTAPNAAASPLPPKPSVPPVRLEAKADTPVSTLNAKLAELSKQMGQMTANMQKLEALEARMSQLEAQVMRNRESPDTAKQVQLLSDEFIKVLVNLQGTPGYGIRHTFHCDKCDEHGTVATVFRCTKCGKETWRGWWPQSRSK